MTYASRNKAAEVTFTSLPANTSTSIDWSGSDEKMVLVVKNASTSAAANLTILAGNGIQAVNDLTVSIPASSVCLLRPEGGQFKNVSGTNRGKIVLKASAALSVGTVSIE